jgi:hypothetical protein
MHSWIIARISSNAKPTPRHHSLDSVLGIGTWNLNTEIPMRGRVKGRNRLTTVDGYTARLGKV